ncbi:MAG: type I restriction enzyme HsdR N-terminal domain-containing protein [Proteobacteria bacterium]|nr:type I restriction enzyme HsdR N-terminal domain-containing protein [Pseudomonadota bacterium]MBU1687598.1 type I restriction enzyme HsdR N-terminal domain-containing protein [Pseudomonadota bacterium]
MPDIPSHHLIHGTLTDYLTGESLVDTDDERIRQKLSRFLVEEKGYSKEDLEPRRKIETLFAKVFVVSKIELVARIDGLPLMIIRYGPGSLVTRERPTLAAARVLEPDRIIPRAVITNGRDAEILDTGSGKVIATGLAGIPDRAELATLTLAPLTALTEGRREKELRILNAYDVEICCAGGPCALPGAEEG